MAAKRKQSGARRPAAQNRKRKKRPEIDEQWSILLFGIGIFLLAITYVEGASVWSWIRLNLLFGVFGVSTYCLAPLVLYAAVLVAIGQPVRAKMGKALLLMALLSGAYLVFSKTDMSGYNFNDGMIALHQTAAASTGLSGGVLGSVFGWSLLTLCGRPGANIILGIFCIVGVMLFTGVTPGDLYYYFSGKANRMKENMAQKAEAREERAAARAEEMRAAQPVQQTFDTQAYAGALAQKRAGSVDVDLGPEAVEEMVLKPDDKPEIGPGGTFGYDALNKEPSLPVSAAVPQQSRAAAKTSVQSPAEAAAPDLASLIQKAAGTPSQLAVDANEQVTIVPARGEGSGYVYPPLSLFQKQKPDDEKNVQEELAHNAELLVKTLASFGVQTRVLDISRGPSVTRYELQPLAGVKISRITGLADDIALNLATTGVRIEAPIPGKAAVGVEIPNKNRSLVSFRSILETPAFSTSTAPLTFAVGKDIAGNCQVGNLTKMPHLLIAGTTGSGKSVCTNGIIMSFLYRCSPQMLRMILIDPKMVEFAQYNGIPHLLMPVVTEPRKAAGALGSAVAEMEKRYHTLAENGVPNIEEYNELAEKDDTLEKMPYIVIVIDELADLMMVAGKEVEDYICRIAQKARAAGMHLVIATQRPSVDVITGLIKANIPSRIGLSVMSQIDSRTILDTGGAEKLLGNGDMLYMPVGVNKPVRVQGAFIRSAEIKGAIDFIKKHSSADYNNEMIAEMEKCAAPEKGSSSDSSDDDSNDPMFNTAVEVIIDAGQASTSLLQRRCKLGYARAARIMDEMEQAHIIGPYEGAKPRQVLISRQQWIEMTMQKASDSTPDIV